MTVSVQRNSETAPVVGERTTPATITEMLHLAIEKGIPVEALEKLVALHERVSDRAAASEFAGDLAHFQTECPPVEKTSTANIATRGGISFTYNYAELDQIANTVRPFLHSRGFSYTWDSETKDKVLHCTCTLRHVNGHSVKAQFSLTIDNPSAMSEQQKHAAALTYAKRMSLIQVLGITTTEPDTDGVSHEKITEDMAHDLHVMAEEVGADHVRFLSYMGVKRFQDITKADFNKALGALEAKRKGEKKAGI